MKFIWKPNSMTKKYDHFFNFISCYNSSNAQKSVFATNYWGKGFRQTQLNFTIFWPNYRFVCNSICWLQAISFRHQLNVAFGIDVLEPCAILTQLNTLVTFICPFTNVKIFLSRLDDLVFHSLFLYKKKKTEKNVTQ